MRPVLKWLAAAALAIWGLSALAGLLPPRARLILLFPAGFGLLAGWSARVIAEESGVRRSRRAAGGVLLLVVAGLANVAWTAYRQSADAARTAAAANPQQSMALRVLESAMADDPELQQRYQEERARLHPTFGDYLASRLLQIGHVAAPWPAVVWGSEVLLGSVAAAWMFLQDARRQRSDASQDQLANSAFLTPDS